MAAHKSGTVESFEIFEITDSDEEVCSINNVEDVAQVSRTTVDDYLVQELNTDDTGISDSLSVVHQNRSMDDEFSLVRSLFDVDSDADDGNDNNQAVLQSLLNSPPNTCKENPEVDQIRQLLPMDIPIQIVFQAGNGTDASVGSGSGKTQSRDKLKCAKKPTSQKSKSDHTYNNIHGGTNFPKIVPNPLQPAPKQTYQEFKDKREAHQFLERRRRHDMTYKFQLLQSLLYPSSEKMSKLFLLNAAAKTVGSLKKQHERLLNELEEAKAYRESVVAKLKALRESTKHKYTAITVNEETGTRTVIRDPNMVNYMDKITSSFKPVSSPEPSHSPIVCRGSDIIPTPQQVATKPAKPKPTGPQSASDLLFKKLKAASSVSTVVSPSLACTSSTVTAKPRPATASTLLGAMAKDAALSLKAMSSPATSPNSKIGLTVVRSKPKSVTLDQVEKKELVLSKCENCGERVAFSSHVQVNISCPRCHHSILQLQESEPNKEPSERLVRATSITSQGSAVDVKPEAAIEISDSSSSSSEASDGSKVTAGDIKDILKDGVEGYVDNVGEDEVIVVIKDDKKSTPTKSPRDAGRAPSLQDEESVSVDSDYNSDSTGEGRRAGARKKLGFS